MQTKVAVFGDKDFCLPFSALGMDIYPAKESEGLIAIAQTIVDGSYAMVIVAENIAPAVQEVFDTVKNYATPCVLVVPFTTESQGFAAGALQKVMKMATGINIFENN